ncbi:hypothetical protein KSP40_PGU003443 [Platanthera guangdongensis]|uniref:Uncharacterized protein n=1 Tax=Platanthera guangdongensis TaxID=2320717 RepID=A0ABR2M7X8_9ASPA
MFVSIKSSEDDFDSLFDKEAAIHGGKSLLCLSLHLRLRKFMEYPRFSFFSRRMVIEKNLFISLRRPSALALSSPSSFASSLIISLRQCRSFLQPRCNFLSPASSNIRL